MATLTNAVLVGSPRIVLLFASKRERGNLPNEAVRARFDVATQAQLVELKRVVWSESLSPHAADADHNMVGSAWVLKRKTVRTEVNGQTGVGSHLQRPWLATR